MGGNVCAHCVRFGSYNNSTVRQQRRRCGHRQRTTAHRERLACVRAARAPCPRSEARSPVALRRPMESTSAFVHTSVPANARAHTKSMPTFCAPAALSRSPRCCCRRQVGPMCFVLARSHLCSNRGEDLPRMTDGAANLRRRWRRRRRPTAPRRNNSESEKALLNSSQWLQPTAWACAAHINGPTAGDKSPMV